LRVRAPLAGDERTAGLGLAVRLAKIHAPGLQSSATAAGSGAPLEMTSSAREADLLEEPAEHDRARHRGRHRRAARCAPPTIARAAADLHRCAVRGAL